MLASAPAQAAAGTPGIPSAPTVVFNETFEQGQDSNVTGLGNYVGNQGQTYTADPYWFNYGQCNGVVVQYANANFGSTYCTAPEVIASRENVRRLADVLGQVNAGVAPGTKASPANGSTSATQANHAVGEFTSSLVGPNNAIEFQSSPLNIAANSSRFYAVSIDVAETSCDYLGGINNSQLIFSLLTGGQELPITRSPIRACTDPRVGYYTSPPLSLGPGYGNGGSYVAAGRFFSDSSTLLSPSQLQNLQIRMRNATGANAGNDSAVDNIRLVDATPQLDKSFTPARVPAGGVSTLTLTVTNSSDLAAKTGWSFTDNLPAGLIVAPNPNLGGTCSAAKSATASGTSISATNGNLAAGQASCTVTVDVTSATVNTYSNGASNISNPVGVLLPNTATVEFFATPGLSIQKSASPATVTAAGDTISYSFLVTNTGNVTLTNVGVADTQAAPAGPLTAGPVCPPEAAAVAPGATILCTGTYRATQADLDAGQVGDTATASGTYLGTPVSSAPSSVTVSAAQTQGISLTKSAGESTIPAAGGTLHYSFVVTNTGNVTLSAVSIAETAFSGAGSVSGISCPASMVAPNAPMTCTATYTVTQADVDAGNITNTATVSATGPKGPVTSSPSSAQVPGVSNGALSLVKTADASRVGSPAKVGDTV
ncbi:MAG TPA: hypothetical protein VJQ61_04185, partial [Sinomonas sp.]|nr:hypothetical protein [Sinomonas sp.]